MRINKYISAAVVGAAILLGMQSCFQDLKQDPPFNYPEEPERPVIEDKDLLLKFDFSDNVNDQSDYQFITNRSGNDSFADGINGKAYKGGGTKPYILISPNPGVGTEGEPDNAVKNLGSFTVAFWMNSPKNDGATGIFTISHPSEFWGNFDIFQEGPASDTQMFLKLHLFSGSGTARTEHWLEAKIEDGFNKWMHVAFIYDATTSTLSTYRDGTRIQQNTIEGLGPITFQTHGPMVIGSLQFMTDPILTSDKGAQDSDWGKFYTGSLDQFYFYRKALTAAEVKNLYDTKQ